MLVENIDYDTLVLGGLYYLRLREQKYWCPDMHFFDSEPIENNYDLRIMKLVSNNKHEDALIISLIGSAFANREAAFKIYDDGWTWMKFSKSTEADFLKYLEDINFKGKGKIRMPKPNLVELLYSYMDFIGSSQLAYFENIIKQEKSYFKAYDRIFYELSNNVIFLKGKFTLPMFLDKTWQLCMLPIIPTEKVAAASELSYAGIKFALGIDIGNKKELAYNLINEVADKARCLPIFARWGVVKYGEEYKAEQEITFEDIKKLPSKKLLKGEKQLNYFEEQIIRGFKSPITEHSLYWNIYRKKHNFSDNSNINSSFKELYALLMRLVCEQDRENATFLIFLHIVSNFDPVFPKKIYESGWNWNKFFISKDDEFRRYLLDNGLSGISNQILSYKNCVGNSQEKYFFNVIHEEQNYFMAYDRIFKEFGKFLETDFLVPAFLDALGQFKVYPILPTEKVPINKIAIENFKLQFPDEETQTADDVRMQILLNLDYTDLPEYMIPYKLNEETGKFENIETGEVLEVSEEDAVEVSDEELEENVVDERYILPIEISRGICLDKYESSKLYVNPNSAKK